MAVTLVPFISLLSFLFQVCYPLLVTVQVASEPKSSPPRVIQWTLYWLIHSLWTIMEINAFWWLTEYLPLYYELKFVFFLWLAHPRFQGAGWLWYRVIADPTARHSTKIREFYELHVPYIPGRLPLSQPVTAPWDPTVEAKSKAVSDRSA